MWQQVRDGDKGLEWNPEGDPPGVEWTVDDRGGGPSRPFRLEGSRLLSNVQAVPSPPLHQQLIPNLASPPT